MIRLSRGFYVGSFAVGWAIAAVSVGLVVATTRVPDWGADATWLVAIITIACLASIYLGVVMLTLFYKMWAAIQDGRARCSPGQAVGLLFIPVFNIYWGFQAIWGFAQDYNRFLQRHSIQAPRLSGGLFLSYVILCWLSWIPFVGILAALANYFVGLGMVSAICNVVNAIHGRDSGYGGERQPRRGIRWGLVAGAMAVSVCVGFLGLALFAGASRHIVNRQKHDCLLNVKNIAIAFQMYLCDWNECFPDSASWCDGLGDYLKDREVFVCPSARNLECGYAYPSSLSLMKAVSLDDIWSTVVVFESDMGWNGAGGPELLPAEPRHIGGENYGFADGHANWYLRTAAPRQVGPGEPWVLPGKLSRAQNGN